MKVIAKKDNQTYICEVRHDEIEKYLDRYYSKDSLKTLSVDQVVNLGKGHDFFRDTKRALEETRKFFESHKSTVKAIADGFLMTVDEPENLDLILGDS